MHLRSLERFDFDSVLLRTTSRCCRSRDYRRDLDRCWSVRRARVAVQTIKAIARRRWHEATDRNVQLVRAADRPAPSPGGALRAGRRAAVPEHHQRRSPDPPIVAAAEGTLDRPSDDEMVADNEAFGIAPLFDGSELERI